MAKIFVSFTIVSPDKFFLIARERDAPLAEVFRSAVLNPPHLQRNITISPVNPVMHSVELWSTVDGVNPDTLRARCDIDASIETTTAFEPIQFIVGRGYGAPQYDPAPDQPVYVNPDLDGKDYLVFRPGFGAMVEGRHYEKISGGGFQFINGWQFSDEEEYTVLISNLIMTVNTSNTDKGYPRDIVEAVDNVVFDNTYYEKLTEINGAFDIMTFDIGDIALIPELTSFGISTHAGNQRYLAISINPGGAIRIDGEDRTLFWMGKGEEYRFIKKGNILRVVNRSGDQHRVGERVSADGLPPLNSIPEIGMWLFKSEYPRIFNDYVNKLPIGELGTGTEDVTPNDANKTKWIIGANKFWVPDSRDRYLKGATNSILPGTPGDEQVGNHTHNGLSQIPTGSHSESSSALSGNITFLVNDTLGTEGSGQCLLIVNSNASNTTRNDVDRIATKFYRII